MVCRHLPGLALAASLLGGAYAAHAEILIHAPGAPGGPTHMLGLDIARALEAVSGDRVSVIGSNPIAAPSHVSSAAADGRTLLLADPETAAQLSQQGGSITLRDTFVEVARVGSRPYALYTGSTGPLPTDARQVANAIKGGAGFFVHHNLTTRACADSLRNYLMLPPSVMLGYRGQAPAMADLTTRPAVFYCAPLLDRVPSGARLVAVSRKSSFQQTTNVPTFAAMDFPVDLVFPTGLFARRDTPKATLYQLQALVTRALQQPDLVVSLGRRQFDLPGSTSQAVLAPSDHARAQAGTPGSTQAPPAGRPATPESPATDAVAVTAPAAAGAAGLPTSPRPESPPRSAGAAGDGGSSIAGSRGPLPSARVALRDATAQCDCSRKLGQCLASAQLRDSQVARVSNGLSSVVVVGLEPPPGQCVEVTASLQERAVIGGRVRTTGHPLYRVIDGPTDVEWRNVGTPASELTYTVPPAQVDCYVCSRRGSGEAPARQTTSNLVRPAGGPYFHAALFEPTPPDSPPPPGWGDAVPVLFIGLSSVSADDAHRRACNWPSHAGMVSQEACAAGTRERTYGYGQTGPYRVGYTQKVLRCGGGGYFAVAMSDGPVGVSCGAPSREAAEAQALQACREGWAAKGLPDGGNGPPRRSDIPATCQIDSSALNDGTFASSGTWRGMQVGGNGLWTYCWGSQRRSRFAGLEGRCADTARHCLANAGDQDCR